MRSAALNDADLSAPAPARAPLAAALAGTVMASPRPACLVGMDGEGGARVLAASTSFGQMLNRPAEELIGLRLDSVLARGPGQPQSRAKPSFDRGRGSLWTIVRPGGGTATVELHVAHVAQSQRNLRLIQFVDVSARETTQRSLREAVRRLQDIVDNSTALVFVKDLEGRYVLANHCFERRFGLRVEDILGRTDHELFPADTADGYRAHDREVLTTSQPLEVEELATELGRTWLSIKFPLLDEDGAPYALGGISTDITERLAIEAAAPAARAEAQRASRSKSEFLSRMSHELRTPLNAILGFGQLLETTPDRSSQRENVAGILSAGRHLLALINDVLEISSIEARALKTTMTTFDVSQPLRDALSLLHPLAIERDIELASDLHGGLMRYVHGDERGLKQALLNLIDNAIKYTPPGGAVRVAFRDVAPSAIRIVVVDTGPGLTSAERQRVFLPFERLATTDAGTTGTGLGLSVARSLVEAMGGRLGVQHSAPGDGSTFFVDLEEVPAPATRPLAVASSPSPAPPPLGAACVLNVEDNESNVEVVRQILGRAGDLTVLIARDATEGIGLATEHVPDVVLLDMHLPDGDGESVLQTLRQDPRTEAIPIVVLSADATATRHATAIALGADAYLTKPLDAAELVETLRQILASKR